MAKKAQAINLKNLSVLAIVLIVAALMVTFLGDVTYDLNQDMGSTSTNLATNESITGNGTVANAGTPTDSTNILNTTVTVRSVNTLLVAANFTLTDAGVFTRVTQLPSGNTVNITYNYTVFTEDAGYNVSRNLLTSISNISGQMGNVGTVIAAALIISVLLGMLFFVGFRGFGGGGGGSGGGGISIR